ncbi:energy-coupling factor transport system ATP-binding protein [Haloactinopolyspora alba]|uniref:Energy-coupling factor transport system ATP-binding protein n=1 Tax=Haloactinopolyspora alba TaxID=648780 RepID=A0A2P8DXD2_9ACTN|nr:ABC transporter ATP-binding protein [Haloactinopolyspora alba]PSL01883.1 energy-coupling factor transport system ATP-binding protein [Haloactinopolyspora alba]
MAPARVVLRGWGWRYAGRRAWACRGVDLDIAPGERVLLIGASGAGKSTMLRGVAGLLDPETAAEHEGAVLIDGEPATSVRGRLGMVQQDPEASLVMSRAGDDVAFGLENAAVPPDAIWPRVDEAMRRVGFGYGRDRATSALSGGEQQRLALAGALVREPAVLALDEPTANLDPPGRADVLAAIDRSLTAEDTTVLIVEHRVDDVMDLVDRVVVLEPGGGVAADGTPARVFAEHGRSLADAGVWVPAPWGPAPPAHLPGPGGAPLAAARGVSLTYPRTSEPALRPTELTAHRGEAVAVTGRNGSGKSTLAMLMAGLLAPDTGSVRLLDDPDRSLHAWRARDLCRRVGTVFQDPEHQFLARTVRDELLIGPRRARLDRTYAAERADELLSRLRLDRLAEANPFTLSGGEKRRLSVAAVLATAPDLLVLDEPTFGQDARTWAELLDLCVSLRADGAALVTVTHDETFAGALADRHVVADGGTVRARADRHPETTTWTRT